MFVDQISRQSVTIREVLALEQTHPLLKNSENKRLLDKTRGLYRFKKIDSECLQDTQRTDDAVKAGDSDFSSIMGPSTIQSTPKGFDEEDVSLFRELFKDMIQRGAKIGQRVVTKRLTQNGHGQIYEKYTKQKMTDKIRGLPYTRIRQWRK